MIITRKQLIKVIQSSLSEDISYSSPAYGNIVIDDPGTELMPAVSDLSALYQRSIDAGDTRSAQLIELLNSELVKSITVNDPAAWQRVGEFMLSNIGFTQQTDLEGAAKVATFYDVVKGENYYSVKTSFDAFAGRRAGVRKAFGASALKLSQMDYIMLPKHAGKRWGCIGCVKQKSLEVPGAIEIHWGITPTRPGTEFEIDESIDMEAAGGVKFINPDTFVPFQKPIKGRQTRLRASSAEQLFGPFAPLWTIRLMQVRELDPEAEADRNKLIRLAGSADTDLLSRIIALLSDNGIMI